MREPLRRALVPAALFLLAGCGSSATPSPTPRPTLVPAAAVGLQPVVASTDLATGPNRFTFGLLQNNHPLSAGVPDLRFYTIRGTKAKYAFAARAAFSNFAQGLAHTQENAAAISLKGVYVTHVSFSKPGLWGLRVTLRRAGKVEHAQTQFSVLRHSLSPAVGSPAPRSHNPTVAQEPATKLDSGRPPDDMHKLSIAQAIGQHRPLLVLFATPAFCTSRLCGPEVEVIEGLERRYRGRANFIHIEVYRNANPADGYAPTMIQWHLKTEPWVFVINRQGIITAKFEGPTPASEIAPALQAAGA